MGEAGRRSHRRFVGDIDGLVMGSSSACFG
jgi:hypothetical protein